MTKPSRPVCWKLRMIGFFLMLVAVVAAGEAREIFRPLEPLVLPLPPGERAVARLKALPDGHVYGFVSAADGQWRFFRIDHHANGKVAMLSGAPEGLVMPPKELLTNYGLAWHWDAERQRGYVLAENGHLTGYDGQGSIEDLGRVAGLRPFERAPDGFQLSRKLLVTREGVVYTAGEDGYIFRYTPGDKSVENLPARLPAVVGREPWASLDAAVEGRDGLIYGGTYDGYIFVFDPETNSVTNHGKPFRAQRTAALVFRGEMLWGVGGGEKDIPRVFSFDPQTRSLTLGGLFTHGITPRVLNYYDPVSACASDETGNIYVGIGGRLGNLYMIRAGDAGGN